MNNPNRRMLLAGAAALGASAASARDGGQPIFDNKGANYSWPKQPGTRKRRPGHPATPATDHGSMPNLRFSFADAHIKARQGGWSREVTQRELPISTSMAGVNMRLTSGGVRELHWHKQAEWSFMLAGRARITAADNDGHNFIADVGPGDLWYFRPAFLIQGLPGEGCEFLLAFPDGEFSEDSTFAITDLFAHTNKEILAKNFAVDSKAFAVVLPSGPLRTSCSMTTASAIAAMSRRLAGSNDGGSAGRSSFAAVSLRNAIMLAKLSSGVLPSGKPTLPCGSCSLGFTKGLQYSNALWAEIPSEAARRCASRRVISPSRTRTGGLTPKQGSRSFGSLYWKKYTDRRHTR
jgi:Cupin